MGERAPASAPRGLDGLTAEELEASRRGFWDEAFTQVLLRRIPPGASVLIDVGCGLATAAHAFLPDLAAARYVGVDADAQRLGDARKLLDGREWASRVELRSGRAERLPCPDAEADVVLCSMTLQHLHDVAAAVAEMGRVLAPGGRLLVVEPDNLANLFYFDGPLEDVNAALRELFAEQRRRRRPADPAIGPAVASILEKRGFSVVEFFPYVVGRTKRRTAKTFLDGVRQVARIVAATLPAGLPAVEACEAALDRAESSLGSGTTGHACQLVPVFVCAADRA